MSEWPSARPSTGRASRPGKGQYLRTDWLTGWFVAGVWAVITVALLAVLWPFAATALESVQQLTDALSTATRNALA